MPRQQSNALPLYFNCVHQIHTMGCLLQRGQTMEVVHHPPASRPRPPDKPGSRPDNGQRPQEAAALTGRGPAVRLDVTRILGRYPAADLNHVPMINGGDSKRPARRHVSKKVET
jgi:hypothetical protein